MFEVKQNASEIWEDQEETTGDDDDNSGDELPSSDGSESVTGLDEAAIEENLGIEVVSSGFLLFEINFYLTEAVDWRRIFACRMARHRRRGQRCRVQG